MRRRTALKVSESSYKENSFFNDPPGPEKILLRQCSRFKSLLGIWQYFTLTRQKETTETKTNRDKWLGQHHTSNGPVLKLPYAICNHEK